MQEVYFRYGSSIIKGNVYKKDDKHLSLQFRFHEGLKDEIKIGFTSARWNPSDKSWTVPDNHRSKFVLSYLQGVDTYAKYNLPLINYNYKRDLYQHQKDMINHALTRRQCILAAEMGTGKTLTAIEVMELSGIKTWWYVAPKSALESVKLELGKWGAGVYPRLMTYEEMVRTLRAWIDGNSPPPAVIFDESSRLKSPQAQRTQAAQYLADQMRDYYGQDPYIILMSGSPAPKSPLDWWAQAEITCPGFLREGNVDKFRDRIAVMKLEENAGGIKYPKVLTYKDNPEKCNVCGKFKDHELHKVEMDDLLTFVPKGQTTHPSDVPHDWKESPNEIELMHKRLEGLVMVKFKKDCLDLPEKIYRTVECKPTPSTLRTAKFIRKSAPTVAQALILLREYSDGFQYHEKLIGQETCTYCKGTKKIPYEGPDGLMDCTHCSAKGYTKIYQTETVECDTPKIDALKDILDEKDEDGRLVVYAGFTGSIDRICATVVKAGWSYIRIDGRGWHSDLGTNDPQKLLTIFQNNRDDYKKVCIVGHPGSAGMGLTLTASDTIVYFSNDFNAESRIQSEDRIYRIGCRGATIIDLVHLPVDQLVIDNLKLKRQLQAITLGQIDAALEKE